MGRQYRLEALGNAQNLSPVERDELGGGCSARGLCEFQKMGILDKTVRHLLCEPEWMCWLAHLNIGSSCT